MDVRIYSTATCPYCIMEKAYLKEQGIDFQNIMVDEDNAKAQELLSLSGQLGVPFTVITKTNGNEVRILGFDKPKIDEVLGLNTSE